MRLSHWLIDILWWQSRFDEKIRLSAEGLALLGEDQRSIEAAMMNTHLAWGYYPKSEIEQVRVYIRRNASFIESLPYTEEICQAYVHIAIISTQADKDVAEAMRWLQALAEKARQSYDLRGLAAAYQHIALVASALNRAITPNQSTS